LYFIFSHCNFSIYNDHCEIKELKNEPFIHWPIMETSQQNYWRTPKKINTSSVLQVFQFQFTLLHTFTVYLFLFHLLIFVSGRYRTRRSLWFVCKWKQQLLSSMFQQSACKYRNNFHVFLFFFQVSCKKGAYRRRFHTPDSVSTIWGRNRLVLDLNLMLCLHISKMILDFQDNRAFLQTSRFLI